VLRKAREFKTNTDASAIPIILFVITIVSCGALYSLFFIEVAYPELKSLVPNSDSKTFIMMLMYALPLIVIVIGGISLIKAGLKRTVYYQ